jgi:hypothetical protein
MNLGHYPLAQFCFAFRVRAYNVNMRRLVPIAAFFTFLALIPAHGQRHAGGGRAMAPTSHGGGFAAHGSSGHSFAPRGGGFTSHPGRSAFGQSSRSSFHQPGFRQPGLNHQRFDRRGLRDGRRGFRDRDRRFRRGFRDCFDCDRWRGFPWWYAGYYDPYWWWDSSSNYDEDYERQLALAEQMDQRSLEQQRFFHQQDQDLYASSSASSARNQVSDQARNRAGDNEGNDPAPPTVLVFRDQRKKEVQNYAIVGQTLWIFATQRTEKIPLADLDLAATTKTNEDSGVEFRVPGTAEGQ